MRRYTGPFGERVVSLLLGALLKVRAHIEDGMDLEVALCHRIDRELRYSEGVSRDEIESADMLRVLLYGNWPEFSGTTDFPVPAPDEDRDHVDELIQQDEGDGVDWDCCYASSRAFYVAFSDHGMYDGNMYDELSEYGRSRRRLLGFMIDELTKESVGR